MIWYMSICFIFLCIVLKIILKLTTRRNGSFKCLVGKTVIVTGSNCGIGLYTALDFASRGAKVILACRDRNRAEAARKKIVEETGNQNVIVELLDLASLKSVRDFARRINSKEDRLDVLVNNAGIVAFKDTTTEDGLSLSMQVNYLGPFLLTTLLIELLKRTGSSRIVNVSSLLAHTSQLKINNLNYFYTSLLSKMFFTNYANSKLCMFLWTHELAKRLQGCPVTVNSIHPGIIYTEILRNTSILHIFLYKSIKVFARSPEEGAQTTIYAAVSKEIQNVSGQFFDNCKIASMPKSFQDDAMAKKVWEISEDFVKLTAEEKCL